MAALTTVNPLIDKPAMPARTQNTDPEHEQGSTGPGLVPGTEATITRLGSGGDGIVERPEGFYFVPYALPGERIRIGGDGAPEVLAPSYAADRATPPCPHFGSCGGCVSQHMNARLYEHWKLDIVRGAFRVQGLLDLLSPVLQPLVHIPLASRRRSTFASKPGQAGTVEIGYRARGTHNLVALSSCSVIEPALAKILPLLHPLMSALPHGHRTARIHAAAFLNGVDVDVQPLDAKASALTSGDRTRLAAVIANSTIIRLRVAGEDVIETAKPVLRTAGVDVRPPTGLFFQAAAAAEEAMIAEVSRALDNKRIKRVVDLFSGVGTFSFAAAARATVKSVDSEARALAALDIARRGGVGLKPIEILRRDIYRDPLSPKELSAFDAAILDPPRAGAEAQIKAVAASPLAHVVYVSCAPATLARDAKTLIDQGFALERLTPIDQFVHTDHVEAVAVFRRPTKARRPGST